MDPLELRLKDQAHALGFSLVGIAPATPSRHAEHYRAWLARGAHGEMGYLSREDAVARRADLALTMQSAKSVIVVAHEYFSDEADETQAPSESNHPESGSPDKEGFAGHAVNHAEHASHGVIARYARGRDYHKVVKKKLLHLLEWLRAQHGDVEGRAYVDTGPLLERELAARAGLGWFGKNTMLIHPRRGSWFFLGCLLVDVELAPDGAFENDHCGSCSRCLEACPTGALLGRDANGAPVIDARLCISYLTIENKGDIPVDLRAQMGNRVYGCDICQEVCPWNGEKFVQIASEPAYRARVAAAPPLGSAQPVESAWHPGTDFPPLIALMEMDDAAWDAFSRGSAIRRAGRAGFLRNVAVALGNWGAAESVPVLAAALTREGALVRGHAAWALGRVGAESARAALVARLAIEEDAGVRREIERALEEPARRTPGEMPVATPAL